MISQSGLGSRVRRTALVVVLAVAGPGVAAEGTIHPGAEGDIEATQRPGVDAHLAALLVAGQSGGDFAGAMTWTLAPTPEVDGRVRVDFVVEVDGCGALEGAPPGPAEIELVVYLIGRDNEVIDHVTAAAPLAQAEDRELACTRGMRFLGSISCPRERSSLRVAVRSSRSGRLLLLRRELDLEPWEGGAPPLLPPFVEVPPESAAWLTVTLPGAHAGSWPVARPVWRADQPLEVLLMGGAARDVGTVAVSVADQLGRTLIEAELHEAGEAAPGEAGWSLPVSVQPSDLPPGSYRLVVSSVEPDGGRRFEEWLPVVIHDDEGMSPWTEGGALAQGGGGRSATEAAVIQDDLGVADARTAYRRALDAWCSGETVAARRLLAELEAPHGATGDGRSWRLLMAAEAGLLSDLAPQRPQAVMAAVLLHRELYPWYLARGETALARHSWESAAVLASELDDLDGFRPPEGFVEAVLLDLADRLVQSSQAEPARQLLETALKVAPESVRTLLAVGMLAERSGRPCDAAEVLRRLVALDPQHRPGRLRLAVCARRCGEAADAAPLLRDLIGDRGDEPWVRTVAVQELARLQIGEGDLEGAIGLLERATEEYPGEQGLRVLLAHALDLAEQPRRAAALMASTPVAAGGEDPSPRYLYSQWQDPDGRWVRSTLATGETIARAACSGGLP